MLNLIIFGSPGAGKGTQASLISKKYHLTPISSGEIFRQELKNGKLGPKIKKYYDSGKLVPDSLTIKIVEAAAKKMIKGAGFIFDGYPRNIKQAKSLNKFFKDNKINLDTVLNMKLDEKKAAERILLRAKTSGRSDDNLETIKKRFTVYHKETEPILKYYQKMNKVTDIDGLPSIKIIFKEINAVIKSLSKK